MATENYVLRIPTRDGKLIKNLYRSPGDTVEVASSGRSCKTCRGYDESLDNDDDATVDLWLTKLPGDNVAFRPRNH